MAATKTKKQPPRHLKAKHKHKETWLNEAMTYVRRHFQAAGYDVPEHVRVSTGWPSKQALSAKKRRIGEAWSNTCSGDDVHEIIISLYLDDPVKVLGVLIHEVVHVTVGVEHGHKKPFAECAKAVGLVKPWTATSESEELTETLEQWAKKLGQYPHAKLDGRQDKKQSTRLQKMECGDCGCKIRVTSKWIDEYGPEWDCPCGAVLVAVDRGRLNMSKVEPCPGCYQFCGKACPEYWPEHRHHEYQAGDSNDGEQTTPEAEETTGDEAD